jgi:hypothetical protein
MALKMYWYRYYTTGTGLNLMQGRHAVFYCIGTCIAKILLNWNTFCYYIKFNLRHALMHF